MSLRDITSAWFNTEIKSTLRFLQLYVRGDVILLLPFLLLILPVGLFSVRWMLILYGLYFAFRFLGEMMYWMMQQFGEKKYRPNDFGFRNIANGDVYVLYQLMAFMGLVVSAGFVLYILTEWG